MGLTMSDNLLIEAVKKYDIYIKNCHALILSRSRKNKITTKSVFLHINKNNFYHLLGIDHLKNNTIEHRSKILFNSLLADIKSNKIEDNRYYKQISNSNNWKEIECRIELLAQFDELIADKATRLIEFNPNGTNTIRTKIKYDYLLHFNSNTDGEFWYLFCRKTDCDGLVIEPISLFKTDKNFHKGNYLWNIEHLYSATMEYSKPRNELYSIL